MKNLLGPRHEPRLRDLTASPTLLAFDFDGTLAPIVGDRDRARAPLRTRRLLARLCRTATCAVISGRGLADLEARLQGIPVAHMVGSHGASLASAAASGFRVGALARALRRALQGVDGLEVEEAGLAITLHYRSAREPRLARERIDQAVRSVAAGMRRVPGKMVVSLVPAGLPHKGDALRALLLQTGLTRALYVGDDGTDEDVFALAGTFDVMGVRVGRTRRSVAEWYVPSRADVDVLLRRLLRFYGDARVGQSAAGGTSGGRITRETSPGTALRGGVT